MSNYVLRRPPSPGVTYEIGMAVCLAPKSTGSGRLRSADDVVLCHATSATSALPFGLIGHVKQKVTNSGEVVVEHVEIVTAGSVIRDFTAITDDGAPLDPGVEYYVSERTPGKLARDPHVPRWRARVGIAIAHDRLKLAVSAPVLDFDGLVVESVWRRADHAALAFVFDDGTDAIFDVRASGLSSPRAIHSILSSPRTIHSIEARSFAGSLISPHGFEVPIPDAHHLQRSPYDPHHEIAALTRTGGSLYVTLDVGDRLVHRVGRATGDTMASDARHPWLEVRADGHTPTHGLQGAGF